MIAILLGILIFYVAMIYLMAYLIGRFEETDNYGKDAYAVQAAFWPIYLAIVTSGAVMEHVYLMGKKARKR